MDDRSLRRMHEARALSDRRRSQGTDTGGADLRHRCVEGWSMIIPWVGFPLANFLKRCEPTSKARFVEFTTLLDRAQMPGTRVPSLPWPYVEGLRMDEALHPLTLLAVGLY